MNDAETVAQKISFDALFALRLFKERKLKIVSCTIATQKKKKEGALTKVFELF